MLFIMIMMNACLKAVVLPPLAACSRHLCTDAGDVYVQHMCFDFVLLLRSLGGGVTDHLTFL